MLRVLAEPVSEVESGATLAIPNAGFATGAISDMSVGFAMVANGGMNTRYNTNIYDQALAPAAGAPVWDLSRIRAH